MIEEGTETYSHTRMLMIVYVVVFWRNKSVDFILLFIAWLTVYPSSIPDPSDLFISFTSIKISVPLADGCYSYFESF